MAASLGSLVLQLAVDTARFQGDLGRAASIAESRMRNIKDTASRAMGALSVAAAAAGAALAASLKQGINRADEFNDLSQAIGVSVENLSQLEFAAKQNGAALEDLGTGLRIFSSQVQDAAAGKKIAETFNAINVSVTDANGKLRPTIAILRDVSDRFRSYADGAGKTALATDLFGRSGNKLVATLNEGAEGLAELAKQADQLGFTISTSTAKAADAFNDRVGIVAATVTAFKTSLAAQLLPTLNSLIRPFTDTATAADRMERSVTVAATAFKLLISAGTIVSAGLSALGNAIGAVAASLVAVAQGEFSRAWEIMKAGVSDYVVTVQAAADRVLEIWDSAANSAVAAAPDQSTKLAAPIIQAAEKARAAAGSFEDDFARTQAKFASDLQRDVNRMFNENTRRWREAGKTATKVVSEISIAADQAARNIQSSFADFLFDPFQDGLKGMLSGFLNVIRRMVAEMAAAAIFSSKKSGGLGFGDFLSGLFGGLFTPRGGASSGGRFSLSGRAGGGPVSGGTPYLVGERGPELFVPSGAGMVVPRAGGGLPTIMINQYVDNRHATGDFIRAYPEIQRRNNEALAATIENTIVTKLRKGAYDRG